MGEKRRSKYNIAIEILQLCKNGAKKTQVVYKTNINFVLVNRYLNGLKAKGLIKKDAPYWRTTEKGKEVLGILNNEVLELIL
jgi:predicted transcriptional regulator